MKGLKEMEKIIIVTDSASDISVEQEKKYGIEVIPFTLAFGEKIYTSRVDYDNEKLYQMLAEYDDIPKSSQITAYTFEEKLKEFYEKGYTDVVFVLINSMGSATYNNSMMAIDSFYEEYPEAEEKMHIYTHDGRSYTGAYGYPVVNAAKMVMEGKKIKEINDYLADLLKKREIYFGIYDLKYASKSGRIPSAAAFIGDKLGIKPVMKIWDREITTAGTCRGEKKLIAKLAQMSVADMEVGSPYQVVYGCDLKCRDDMIKKMTDLVGYGPDDCYQIGAEVSANAGPRIAGVIFNAKQA